MKINRSSSDEYVKYGRQKIIWLYDNEAMNIFASQYPRYHDIAVSWEPYDVDQVIIKLDDGRMCLYDSSEKRLKFIRPFAQSSELDKDEWKDRFSYLLKESMWRSHKIQKDLAMEIGVTEAMVNRYCSGQAIPSALILQQIAESLQCNVSELLPHDFVVTRGESRD